MKVTPTDVARMFKSMPGVTWTMARRAALVSAQRTVRELKKESPVDQGGFRAAWQAKAGAMALGYLAQVENRHPMAGVIERGARPHGVNREGIEAIRAWVIRHGIAKTRRGAKVTKRNAAKNTEAIDAVVWGIVKKLKEKGQKGLFLVEKQMSDSVHWMQAELERLLNDLGKNPPK